ncbi:MAG: hypothetical protein DWQ04_25535 [Chloroflexi bacterium]|nr:MAG: hypothetical protein DWQ04_25535 [Chloroflexota bacterium]
MVWIPVGEGVDEVAHFEFIRFVKEQHTLPVQPTQPSEPISVWMGHHPPLYYMLNALFLTGQNTSSPEQPFRPNPHFVWAENDGRNGWNVMLHAGQDEFPGEGVIRAFFTVRLLGIFYGLISIFALFQATQNAFPTISWLPFLATATIAFNPSFIYMSSTIHHDILLTMWFALGTWWMMHYLQHRTLYHALLAGILVGCAMLTKISGVVLGLGIGLVIVIYAYQKQNWRLFWRDSIISGGVAALIAGGWFIRNRLLYGDFLGWNAYRYVFHNNLRPEPSLYLGITDFFRQASRNFWGGFGFMHITFPDISYYFWVGTAVILFGWFFLFLRNKKFFNQYAHVLIGGFALLIGILGVYLRFSTINLGAGHGRYLFPAAFPIGILYSVGILGFVGQRALKWVALLSYSSLLVYSLWLPIVHILPKYAPLTAIDTLPSTAQVVNQQLSPGINLVGYEVKADQPLIAGMGLETVLYWQAVTDLDAVSDPKLVLTLETPNGELLSRHQGWLTPSLPPASWPQGKILVTQESLYVPNKELPGIIHLKAKAQGNIGSDAFLVSELQTVGGASLIEANQLPNDLAVLFDNELYLRGFTLSGEIFHPEETMTINLFWQVHATPTANHTSFIHLIDASGQLVAQLDRPAGGSQSPTSTWQKGQIWRDSYPLLLPANLPDGSYALRVGLYDWPSLERLPISNSEEDSWQLGNFQIIEDN